MEASTTRADGQRIGRLNLLDRHGTAVKGSAPACPLSHQWRRILNVTVAGALLFVAAPVMLAIAVAMKLACPGPLLFVQHRVGLDRRNGFQASRNSRRNTDLGGRPFRMYKFRTMYADASTRSDEVWARPDDPRVTPLGRFLRQYRLDELPQLVNVLRGDMNLVGPRPEQPKIFADLRAQIEGYAERQRVRPGITGWAQVNHHYDTDIESARRKLSLDLEYIERQSVIEDIKIIVRTIPVVFLRRGAW